MNETEWPISVEIRRMDSILLEDFLSLVRSKSDMACPIEGSIGRITSISQGDTEVADIKLSGSGYGAGSILDSFVQKLTPGSKEVRICFRCVSQSMYEAKVHALAESGVFPRIQYDPPSLTLVFAEGEIGDIDRSLEAIAQYIVLDKLACHQRPIERSHC